MFGLASKKDHPDLYEGLENTLSPADAVTIVFHPTLKNILLIYTKTGEPVTSGKKITCDDLETAIMFLRGINPQVTTVSSPKNIPEILEPKQEIGFMAKAA